MMAVVEDEDGPPAKRLKQSNKSPQTKRWNPSSENPYIWLRDQGFTSDSQTNPFSPITGMEEEAETTSPTPLPLREPPPAPPADDRHQTNHDRSASEHSSADRSSRGRSRSVGRTARSNSRRDNNRLRFRRRTPSPVDRANRVDRPPRSSSSSTCRLYGPRARPSRCRRIASSEPRPLWRSWLMS